MALIKFDTRAEYAINGFTDDPTTYNNAVEQLTTNGITNWEQALVLANSMPVDPNAPTFVVFVSDGAPTARISRLNLSDDNLYTLNGSGFYRVEDYYGIFGSGSYSVDHYNVAVKQGQAIVAAGKELYSIGLSTDASSMEGFTTDSGAPASHYFPANEPDDLTDAFDKIAGAVEESLGFTDVSINDGVTELTTVETDALTGTPENFVYRKGTNEDPLQNAEWTGDDVPQATITDDNHVIWDINEIGRLEKGVTYSVTFTVWPSQESYNIIADINNGIIRDASGNIVRTGTPAEAYAAQPENVRNQIGIVGNSYTLLTNTGCNVSYKFNGNDGSKEATVKKAGSMPLDTTFFAMHKDWQNQLPQDTRTASVLTKEDGGVSYLVDSDGNFILDGENRIVADWNNFNSWKDKAVYYVDLIVTKGSSDYTEVRLTSDKSWTWDQMFVAPGVITHGSGNSGSLTVRETGDDYSVREKPSESYYWELFAETYHPMVINGTAYVLQKVTSDAPSLSNNTYDGDYYNINGVVYKKLGSADDARISAVNYRRSYLNITKTVSGDNAPEDAFFTYTVKLENPNGLYQGASGYSVDNDDFWFSIYDPANQVTVKDASCVSGAEAEAGDTGYWHFANVQGGKEITIKIKAGWNVRFTNLVSGTTYEITESISGMEPGFVFDKVSATANVNGTAQTYNPTIAAAKISGTIENPNTDYTVTYANKYLGVFYVYHSSDLEVQRFPMAENGVPYSAEKTFDIYSLTKSGTLYGGYYSDYAGKSSGFDAAALTYKDGKSSDASGTVYSYQYIKGSKESGNAAWDYAKGYGKDGNKDGKAMVPTANTVYYLKEVPTGYLMPYTHYTYYKADKKLGTMWSITGTDDLCYSKVGFKVRTDDKPAIMLEVMTITPQNNSSSIVNLTAAKVFKSKGVLEGYLGYADITDYIGSETLIQQYWTTKDGITVFGLKQRTLTYTDTTITGIKKSDTDYKP